ncbi:MAG: MFS transporter [Hyphomonadaceae bacterium]
MRIAALRALLSNRNYAIYSAGNAVSLTGTWIHGIAFAWLVWEMTRSPFWLGVVATAGLIPTLFAGLIGGVLADRMDRLRLTIITQALCFVITFTLFVLFELNALNVWILIVFKVLLATAVAISQPARMALIPNLVGPQMIGPAVSFGSMVFNTARFLGPAIAGVIISTAGIGPAFLINSLTFVVMAGAILTLKLPPGTTRPPPRARADSGVFSHFSETAGYVRAHGGVLTLFLLLTVVVVAVRPISDFLPAIATRVYDMGVSGVAMLTSSAAAGSILGGLWTAGRDVKGLTFSALRASLFYTACIVAFVLMRNFWIGCFIFAGAGFFTAIFAISAQTLVQSSVEDDMRGRVMSLWFILTRGGPDLGAFIVGLGGELVGLQATFIVGAALAALMTIWAWQRRELLAAKLEAVKSSYAATP